MRDWKISDHFQKCLNDVSGNHTQRGIGEDTEAPFRHGTYHGEHINVALHSLLELSPS
jgi:hypothetical protein